MTEIQCKVKYGNLKKLVEQMSKQYKIKVGLLADNHGGDEVSKNLDMAGLGAIQEFGAVIQVTDKMKGWLGAHGLHLKKDTTQIVIPPRSFLQMPLMKSRALLKKINDNFVGAGSMELAEYLVETGDTELLKMLANAVGFGAVQQINEAFETGGFGEWQPDSPFTIAQKGSSQVLVDKGDLARRITYEIEE